MNRINGVPKLFIVLVSSLLLFASGCSRSFWRSQADFDGLNLLENKQFDPRWDIPRTTVEADPRSRFYDPYDLDFEPLPPDDPAANQYMSWLYGMRGYKSWHRFGESMSVENPQWLANFGIQPDRFHDIFRASDGITVVPVASLSTPEKDADRLVPTIENLTLGQAIELSSIHSRDYQTQLENLFLSSLQLSLDQFQFNVRYLAFGGKTPNGSATYSTTPGGTSSMLFASQGGISQILPTGGQWIVGLANNTLWLFSGGQHSSSQSLLSYSLVQPLLQGAGRKVVLESLTFSERNVLYNTRILARYRKVFFADAVVNTSGGSTSSLAGISASSGSSVVNPTVISTNAGNPIAPGSTVGSSSASGGNAQGYLGLLYQYQQVLNQRENVALLRGQTERLRELVSQTPFRRLPAGALPNGIEFPSDLAQKIEYSAQTRRLRWKSTELMTDEERERLLTLSQDVQYLTAIRGLYNQLRIGVTTVDILTVATNLTRAEIQERALTLSFFEEIDQYKFFLGLPIDMQMSIDTSMLKPFELTDPHLIQAETEIIDFIKRTVVLNEEDPSLEDLRSLTDDFAVLAGKVKKYGIEILEDDFRRVIAHTPRRMSKLINDDSRELVRRMLERDSIIFESVKADFKETLQLIQQLRQNLSPDEVPVKVRAEVLGIIKDAREDLLVAVQNMRVLQVGQRAELIDVQDFELDVDEAVAIALENRLDLMNARARVMDARRNMEVAANRLEAVLNLVATGSINTPNTGNHPFDFRGANSTYQFGVQMTAPLDQMQARNLYRGSLISYQQARRSYMLLEDQVKYDIRTSWRQMQVNRQNLETSRKNLRQAALQFDINVANNLNPRSQGGGGAGGGGGGAAGGGAGGGQAGTTNLGNSSGLNINNALGALVQAQNGLIQYWTSYERNRINIHRDMDIMQIDERGLWIDPVYQNLGARGESFINEPDNVPTPQPSTRNLPRPKNDESGVVRLVRGTTTRQKDVAVETAGGAAADTGAAGRWRTRRVATDPSKADATEE
ncbi:MAG: TolC family protein [Planctomycetes bacterium]|nr:TolC family protein [Planctomycetota bacterium]